MALYNLRTNPTQPDLPFTITKFTSELEVESSYSVGNTVCECPAGHRPKCRHREMLPALRERIDTAWFYCFETKSWEDPTGEAAKHDEVAEHDAETGGLDADQASSERVHVPTRDDNTDEGIDEGLPITGEELEPSTLAAMSPASPSASLRGEPVTLGNPAPSPAPQGTFKRRI